MSDPQPDDPYKEPDNSTVDDWHGQKVDRLKDEAEQADADADDDKDEKGKGGSTRASGTSAG